MNAVLALLVIGFCIFLPIAFATEVSTCAGLTMPRPSPSPKPSPNPNQVSTCWSNYALTHNPNL